MDNKRVSCSLKENQKIMEQLLSDCQDVEIRKLKIGIGNPVDGTAFFTEPTAGNLLELGQIMSSLFKEDGKEVLKRVQERQTGIMDVSEQATWGEVLSGFFSGDLILFIDGYDKGLKIPAKGYPGIGVSEADSEKGVRGSDESFTDSVKVNASLLRKRIRCSSLKIRKYSVGERSNTLVYVAYMEGIVQAKVIEELEKRMDTYKIDRITDSGVEQQLLTDAPRSIFPQIQSTRRPSFAAEELLEGRAVLIVDNSPEVLLLPSSYQNFLSAADDSYLNYQVVCMVRALRYIASFFAITFPGLYIVASTFEKQLIPTALLLTVERAAANTPFSPTTEVILMEISFELLREAGVRVPGDLGNAIGIVGGLIIGSAAVDANLVSPIVVIVVAFTALCSFSIPSEELSQSFRVLKFGMIVASVLLGPLGFFLGLLAITLHLSSLESLGYPFLRKVHMTFQKPVVEKRLRGAYGRQKNPVRLRKVGKENKE